MTYKIIGAKVGDHKVVNISTESLTGKLFGDKS